ncbi:MAG: hypothetical protein FJZ49_08415 [Candidatus Verstraetearchaeota archaeon]|nr:hypothetical protein [Candidatus Verstraetearchaeota archaeon]
MFHGMRGYKDRGVIASASLAVICAVIISLSVGPVASWSNGGYSDSSSNPKYGTHDWIAEHALDWLPAEEKQYIVNNLPLYLYGTELPDNGGAPDGIGDTVKHHVYYWSNGSIQDGASAIRASEEYTEALNLLKAGRYADAAKTAGIMSHYIADMAVFGHVMGAGTSWGAESHHSDYEEYVNARTSGYSAEFNAYLYYDGSLEYVSAYDSALRLAYNTTFGAGGSSTCVWMDSNYNWSDPVFKNRAGQSLNLAVNYVTDVLHMLYLDAAQQSPKSPSSISISVSPSTVTVGSSLTVSGSISPVRSGVAVTISYSGDGQWSILATVTSSSDGSYSYAWTPASVGSYQLKASWAGDAAYDEATSAVASVTINKIPTSVSCRASLSEINVGDTITITGSISPAISGKIVTLTYTKPDGGTLTRTATTGSDGSYSDSYKVDDVGSWNVQASWEGDPERQGAISQSISFSAKKSGCVIATATYGSEIAPQVQLLRGFRDNVALKTFAGNSFMILFNAWYYSWSPPVASAIAPDPTIKAVMRVILQPLLNILQVAAATFSLFSFNGELGIVMAGLVASALIGLVYVAPITTIALTAISRWRGHAPRLCRIKILMVPWFVSLAAILLAEFSASPLLMMTAAGAFVIFTIATVAGSIALKVANLANPTKK